jgi:hypothetical protein
MVQSSQPLLDGGGTHIMTLGVFLTPLSKGTHTISYQATFAGAAVAPTYGVTFLKFVNTYMVMSSSEAERRVPVLLGVPRGGVRRSGPDRPTRRRLD